MGSAMDDSLRHIGGCSEKSDRVVCRHGGDKEGNYALCRNI